MNQLLDLIIFLYQRPHSGAFPINDGFSPEKVQESNI